MIKDQAGPDCLTEDGCPGGFQLLRCFFIRSLPHSIISMFTLQKMQFTVSTFLFLMVFIFKGKDSSQKSQTKTGKGVQALHQGNTILHSQGSYFSLPLIYSQKCCSRCCHVWKYIDTCSHCQSMNAAAMQWTNTHHLFQEYISIPALMHALIQHLGQQCRILVLQKGNISCPKRQNERKSSSFSQLIGWAMGKTFDLIKKVFRRVMEKLGVGFLLANHSASINCKTGYLRIVHRFHLMSQILTLYSSSVELLL